MRAIVVCLASAGLWGVLAGCDEAGARVGREAAPAAIPPPSRNCFLSPQEAAKRIAAGGAFVLDVREKDEYDAAHIPGAALIPLGQLEAKIAANDLFPQINRGRTPRKDQTIIVYCASGIRALRAVRTLRKMGYLDAWAIEGGLADCAAAGLPAEK